MTIRPIETDDLKHGFVETLENLRPIGNVSHEVLMATFSEIDFDPNHMIYVAEEGGQIVGSITVLFEQKFIHHCGRVAHIEDVVVRKGFEGKGIGRKLVEHAIGEARVDECYKIILDCSEQNAGFYENLGFKRCEIEMRLDLPV